ncbi:STAS-like domain-containing protein [Leptospira yasudae]|uniref:STAS-like domain-containing protein n=1 Tax=Leptospira yasudae TaxID=2202201 RepID=UPI001C4FFEAD|nr:DUF4325 domain-containing protein [Leptospira yasudae]MBW0435209.1 STAS-like domain-containing protein [Leptospira yasudae]
MEVDVGREFYHRLVNRDKHQGDGKFTAVEFRKKYLKEFDSKKYWENPSIRIVFNFENVEKIGPSFANEAFAYFMKYVDPKIFNRYVQFKNLSKIAKMIIDQELETGYSKG